MSDDTPKKPRGRPQTLDADRVAELAMQAYWHEGPTEVSINALSARAGVSKPSLYRAFGGEDGLTHAALRTYAAQVLAEVLAILDAPDGFEAALEGLVHYASESPLSDPGCLFVKMRAARDRFGPQTRGLIDALADGATAAYAAFLDTARARGEWAGRVPTDLAARYLGAQIEAALARRAAGVPSDEVRAVLALALSVLTAPDRPDP